MVPAPAAPYWAMQNPQPRHFPQWKVYILGVVAAEYSRTPVITAILTPSTRFRFGGFVQELLKPIRLSRSLLTKTRAPRNTGIYTAFAE